MLCGIFQAYNFLGSTNELFTGELEEVVAKVGNSLKTLQAFRASYEEHKAKLRTYYKEGEKVHEWEFAAPLVFARFDKFVDRVGTLRVSLLVQVDKSMNSIIFIYL